VVSPLAKEVAWEWWLAAAAQRDKKESCHMLLVQGKTKFKTQKVDFSCTHIALAPSQNQTNH
jgi:hypothetical protein